MLDKLKSIISPGAAAGDAEKEALKAQVADLSNRLAAVEARFSPPPAPEPPLPRIILCAFKGDEQPRPIRFGNTMKTLYTWEFADRLHAGAYHDNLAANAKAFLIERQGYTAYADTLTEAEAKEAHQILLAEIELAASKKMAEADRRFIITAGPPGEKLSPSHIKGAFPHLFEWEPVERLRADIFRNVEDAWKSAEWHRKAKLEVRISELTREEISEHAPIPAPKRSLPGKDVFAVAPTDWRTDYLKRPKPNTQSRQPDADLYAACNVMGV